ncbi:MAG TPA: hypothetical protein VEW69_06255 [Alphaproteobacteria bacterium]|nr:hypothetical protein [Alphaproteobacteria bacterium]
MATASAPATPTLAQLLQQRRMEDRLNMALPVKLYFDESGAAVEWSCTYEISAKSARLLRTPNVKSVGQEVWLQRNNRRAKYRVTWIGEADSPKAFQFGADCLEDRLIWDDDVQGRLRR